MISSVLVGRVGPVAAEEEVEDGAWVFIRPRRLGGRGSGWSG